MSAYVVPHGEGVGKGAGGVGEEHYISQSEGRHFTGGHHFPRHSHLWHRDVTKSAGIRFAVCDTVVVPAPVLARVAIAMHPLLMRLTVWVGYIDMSCSPRTRTWHGLLSACV